MNTSGKTAMSRKALSAPMRWLHEQERLYGSVLDFGCGKGFDADTLGLVGYDPNHRPETWDETVIRQSWDTVTCIYVLNLLETREDRVRVLETIQGLLAAYGDAYIVVRNDKECLRGQTKSGTWQGNIELKLPIVHQTRQYRMYLLTRYENVADICD